MVKMFVIIVLGWFCALSQGQVCSRSVCLPGEYNKMDLPETEEGEPVTITTTILLIDVFKVHPGTFTLDLSLYIRFEWTDNRIIINENDTAVEVQKGFMDLVWKPDLYIWDMNKEHSYSKQLTRENMFVEADYENDYETTVIYSTEIDVGVVWPMDFFRFPFDSHECQLRLSSFVYEDEDIVTFTTEGMSAPDKRLNKDKISKYHIEVDYLNNSRIDSRNFPGFFDSAPGLRIVLTTKPEKYLWVYFLPSSMFTLTSWNSWKLF